MLKESKSTASMNSSGAKKLSPLQMLEHLLNKPFFIMLLLVICIIGALRVLQINYTDYITHARASWNVYMNHILPFQDPIEQVHLSFYNPIHAAYLNAPFLLFGRYVAAFFNVLFVMMLLVGERRGWAALATMLFVISPPVVYVFAAVNVPGVTTALGLILLLARKKGVMRGYAWAVMAGRPQDNALMLVWSGIKGLRERDWKAILFSLALMIPSIMTLDHWLSITPRTVSEVPIQPGDFYTLSLPLNIGLLPAILIVGLIIGWRLIVVDVNLKNFGVRVRRRAWETISLTESTWFIYVLWLLLEPYFLAYVLWVLLLPLRLFDTKRTLIAFVCIFVIGATTFNTLVLDSAWISGLLTVSVIALLTPKHQQPATLA